MGVGWNEGVSGPLPAFAIVTIATLPSPAICALSTSNVHCRLLERRDPLLPRPGVIETADNGCLGASASGASGRLRVCHARWLAGADLAPLPGSDDEK